jgi:hypothetical protein
VYKVLSELSACSSILSNFSSSKLWTLAVVSGSLSDICSPAKEVRHSR